MSEKWILGILGAVVLYSCVQDGKPKVAPAPAVHFSPEVYVPPPASVVSHDAPPAQYRPLTFHGMPCTQGCSGHEAGYEWARDNDITDPSDCGGDSQSFIEGCESYAEEHQQSEEAETEE